MHTQTHIRLTEFQTKKQTKIQTNIEDKHTDKQKYTHAHAITHKTHLQPNHCEVVHN